MLLQICKIPLNFSLFKDSFARKLQNRYKNFACAKKPVFRFNVKFNKRQQNPFKPSLTEKGGLLTIKRGDFHCVIDLKTRNGVLEISPKIQSFDSFLRTFYSWLLIQNNGLLVHAAGAVINGKSCLFVGKSGAGKSTIARQIISHKSQVTRYKILSDELMSLRIINGKTKIYPSMFWGEMGQGIEARGERRERSEGIILKKMFFLKKSEHNRLNKISKTDFCKRMLACVMNFSKEPGDAQKTLKTIDTLADKIQYFELEFTRHYPFNPAG